MQRDQTLNETLLTDKEELLDSKHLAWKQKMLNKKNNIGGSSFLQLIMFTWVQPLLSYGNKHTVQVDMMPQLPEKYSTASEFNKFHNIWQNMEKSKKQGWTLIKALFKLHLKQWLLLLLAILIVVSLFMLFPVLTALNVDYLSNHRDNVERGIFLFSLTFFVSVIHRVIFSQYFYRFMNLGIRLSNVVTMIVYNKSLKYSPAAGKEFSEAQITNYSQVDAQRLVYVGDQIAAFFYGPLQIIAGLVMMYFALGFTFLTTIGLMFLILIASYFISKVSVALNEKSLKAKDERMKVTEEMLDIIRYIKITAIEKFFFRKVNQKRQKEIKITVSKGLNFVILAGLFWLATPLFITSAFFTYILLGNGISSEVAFTTMTIVNLFQYPMYSLPNAVSETIQIITSLKRIQKFLFAQQISTQHITFTDGDSKNAIEISKGNFYWKRQSKKEEQKSDKQKQEDKAKAKEKDKLKKEEKDKIGVNEVEIEKQSEDNLNTLNDDASDCSDQELKKFLEKDEEGKPLYIHALKDLNTKIQKGSFTMIMGDIGSGKTSLLMAIVNQMLTSSNSKISISGTIAYSPQKPWIMSKTLKQNITFATTLDQKRFDKVIYYACLDSDLKMLPKGVQTQIGQKGINISGGQKARVSLARSLYSDRDIFLLDDILSAVDVHVGEFIVKETVKDFLRGKTVIMPTHAIKFASFADQIIIMKKGKIVRKGRYEDICDTAEFQQISQKQQKQQKTQQTQLTEEQKLEAQMNMVKQMLKLKTKTKSASKDDRVQIQNDQILEELMIPQDQEEGEISAAVVKKFIKLSGGMFRFAGLIIFALLCFSAVKTVAAIQIQIWCQSPSEQDYELYVFIGLNAASVIFLSLTCYTVVIAGARQSTNVHVEMLKRLLYASLGNFYNRVPTGRIVNRLTKDLRELDQSIMYSFLFFLINFAELLVTLAICVYTTSPLTIIPMVVVGYLANLLRKYYLRTQMEVSRFEKSTNSPVVSGLLSTISGLSTVRAFKKQAQFTNWQNQTFDLNKRVRLTKSGLENWFANTLAFMCFFINMPCIAYCMFSSTSDSSVIGLLMTYSMYLIFNVSGLILCEADFQTKLVSVQRIYKFMEIQPEKRYIQYCKNWTPEEEDGEQIVKNGDLQFQKVKVRYRKDLPDVIKGIDCKIKAGEKIGIVGRTGAGKTTIINTLLGVTEISEGKILLDGTSIEEVSMKGLRQSVTMIDQDPTLIKSSFRENLDITHRYSDQELEDVLRECNLWEVIEEKGGIEAAVSNTSLSAGEKQLLCICRAFLKHSRVVLIDEATANIDVRNDSLIQKVISEKFKESTVLTIAHRLSTLKSSDKIMVMEQGRLMEFGSPNELENKQGGIYSEMMKKNQQEMLK